MVSGTFILHYFYISDGMEFWQPATLAVFDSFEFQPLILRHHLLSSLEIKTLLAFAGQLFSRGIDLFSTICTVG